MDRGVSPPPRSGHGHIPERQNAITPPWEQSSTMQESLTNEGTATPLSAATRHALPALCTACNESVSVRHPPKQDQYRQPQRSYSISNGSSFEPKPQRGSANQPMSYETPAFSPSMMSPEAFVPTSNTSPVRIPGRPLPPLTPPGSTPTDDVSDSVHNVTALPGTMSTRPGTRRHIVEQEKCCGDSQESKTPSESDNFGARLKTTLQGVFKKRHPDETQFIRIGQKHWTED